MAVNLSKGGKVSLAKAASDSGVTGSLQEIRVGLGWDANAYDSGGEFDLDASAFMLASNGKCPSSDCFVYYNNLEQPGMKHMGDERTGDTEGDDEQIVISLSKLNPNIERIAFTVTIYDAVNRHQTFGQVSNAYIHVCDNNSGKEIIRYDLSEDFSIETALVVGEIYKHNGEWKFNAIGQGYSGGLEALCSNYGVDI